MILTYRCPTCLVRYPAPAMISRDGRPIRRYVCHGGWPDANHLGKIPVYHVPRATERIP